MNPTAKVEGLKELESTMDEFLTRATAKNVMRRALKDAGEPVAEDVNDNAPVGRQVNLSKSYKYGTKLNPSQRSKQNKLFREQANKPLVVGYIGTSDPAGVQQEFGNINHPAQIHFRPVWDSSKLSVLNKIRLSLKKNVANAVKRAKKKALKVKK